jgi:hypothetical protein
MVLEGRLLPKAVGILFVTYFVANLAHFVHNAEFIAFYPNMPAWITRETVYLAWLSIASVGVTGLVVLKLGLRGVGALLVGIYGAFGLDGLGHYTLALCSEHTLAANVTVWSDVVAGVLLATASVLMFCRTIGRR